MKANLIQTLSWRLAVIFCGVWLAALPARPQAETNSPNAGTNDLSGTITNADGAVPSEPTPEPEADAPARHGHRHPSGAKVIIGHDYQLKPGETAEAVVVIGGDAHVAGNVRSAAVVVGGDLDVTGKVREGAVVVMGDLTIHSNAVVDGEAVAVLGGLTVKSNAQVSGNAVAVGGGLNVADPGCVRGNMQDVELPAFGSPDFVPLTKWFKQCVVKMRPLSFKVGWVWAVAGAFFLFYLAVALVLPRPIRACVGELERRPFTAFFQGLLAIPLGFIVCVILIATGIGILVVLVLVPALIFAALVGKAAVLEHIGDSLRRVTGMAQPLAPALALLGGAIIVAAVYLIPVLGLLAFAVISLWGFGAALLAAFGSMKREAPPKPAPAAPRDLTPAATPGQPAYAAPAAATSAAGFSNPGEAGFAFAGAAATAPGAGPQIFAGPPPMSSTPSAVPEALVYPRAGFWDRMGAAFLDFVLVCILGAIVKGPPLALIVGLAYFAGMWAWKGTTIGGVVLGLKVVRLDNRPVTLVVAIVRGLAAAFSAMMLFLGFLWIAWDPEKQGWHDRIAGTVVIRVPRSTPLVLL